MRGTREAIHTFLTALAFGTRIPAPAAAFNGARAARCAVYLPLIGALIGGAAALVFTGARLLFPQSVAVALSMTAAIWLTGALHEDGLADFCDGFGGGWTRERILEIMKDSRLGSYGAIGLWLVLLLKWLALSSLPSGQVAPALIAGHGLSRFFAVAFMRTHAYAGETAAARAAPFYAPMSTRGLVGAGLTAWPLLLLFAQPAVFLSLPLLIFLHWRLGRFLTRRLGGYTGDCLGAAQQLSETVFLLFLLGWTGPA